MDKKQNSRVIWKFYLFPTDWRLIFRIIAVLVSWYINNSIVWGILHYCFGWAYLVYVILTGGFSDGGLGEIMKYYLG